MNRFMTQILRPLIWHMIMKIYQIWLLLALGIPPKSLSNFFYVPCRERAFVSQCSINFMKYGHIIYHWNANFKNQCLSQYVAGLLAKISWFIKRGKDMTTPVGTHHSLVQQFWLFTTISSMNIMQKRFKWFTFLQKYFWAGRFGHIINSSSWKLHNVYSEINTNLCCKPF